MSYRGDFNLDGQTGVSAIIRLALYCEYELDLDILNIGRAGLDRRETCTLEMSGRWFAYEIKIDGGYVFLAVEMMDRGDKPEKLFRIGDTVAGWTTIQKFVLALETSGLKSLSPRPCQIGEPVPTDSS